MIWLVGMENKIRFSFFISLLLCWNKHMVKWNSKQVDGKNSATMQTILCFSSLNYIDFLRNTVIVYRVCRILNALQMFVLYAKSKWILALRPKLLFNLVSIIDKCRLSQINVLIWIGSMNWLPVRWMYIIFRYVDWYINFHLIPAPSKSKPLSIPSNIN